MEENGVWRTVGGRRIFIKEGQDLASAMKESGKFSKKKDELYEKDEVDEIENDIKSIKNGKSEIYESMNTESYRKILKYLGIKEPNVLKKITRIGYDGTFTCVGNVSIREMRTFGETLQKIMES